MIPVTTPTQSYMTPLLCVTKGISITKPTNSARHARQAAPSALTLLSAIDALGNLYLQEAPAKNAVP